MPLTSSFTTAGVFSAITSINVPPPADTTARYWKNTTESNSWYTLADWSADPDGRIAATVLPLSTTNVRIDNGGLVIDIDDDRWVAPALIRGNGNIVTVTSNNNSHFLSNYIGNFVFTGSAIFDDAIDPVEGLFWRGTGDGTSWYDINNWTHDSAGLVAATLLPSETANVTIAADGLTINLDYNQNGVHWVSPASISSGTHDVHVDSTASPGAIFDNANISSTTGTWYFLHNTQLGQP